MINKIKSGQFGVVTYYTDTEEDIENLPVSDSTGTMAFCQENSKRYILDGNKEWTEISISSGGSGGSGNLSDFEIYIANYGDSNTYTVNYGAIDPYVRVLYS